MKTIRKGIYPLKKTKFYVGDEVEVHTTYGIYNTKIIRYTGPIIEILPDHYFYPNDKVKVVGYRIKVFEGATITTTKENLKLI